MSVGRIAGVVPPLLLLCRCRAARMLLKFESKCGQELSLVVFRMARPHNAHTRTRPQKHRPWLSQNEQFQVRLLLSYTVAVGTSKAYGGKQAHKRQQAGRIWQKKKRKKKKLNDTSVLEACSWLLLLWGILLFLKKS